MKLLVVVDMQNDFVNGSLGTPEALKIVPQVVEEINKTISDGGIVAFTLDTHNRDTYSNTQEGKKLPVEHCIPGTYGWELIDELKEIRSNNRTSTSSTVKHTFGSTQLAMGIVNDKKITEVELVGVCTDICVVSNALMIKAFNPELPVKVKSSCCAGTSTDAHNKALDVMRSCQINIE